MAISSEQLKRFIELYSQEYGVILDEKKAVEEFSKLSQLYEIIYRNNNQLQK